MHSLKSKLTLSYAMVIVLCVLLISGVTNYFSDKHFREYVQQNQEQRNKDIVAQLSRQYKDNGEWDYDEIETIGVNALENGLIIKVKDESGNIIWDATRHNNGMCQRILTQMSNNISKRYPFIKGEYTEIPYTIYDTLNKVGVVEIGSYGAYYLNDHDLNFINTLNEVLVGAGFLSLIFAIAIGHIMSKRLTSPISSVIESAKAIEKGYFSNRVSSKTDTTEINQLTETINALADTMEKQELLRKRLTADLAHELRTPLATLQSHMEAMIDGIWEPETERLISCHDEIVRISKMVGDLEKLARYEGENLILSKEYFDITELIRRLVQNFENGFLNKNIETTILGKKEEVYADKDKISQVIVNLLSNALKYTPQGGAVEISVRKAEDVTEIAIRDNGPGIPEEDLPYIFERFYRADKSRNRLTGGSGIGLTIAKSIVTAHGGNIEVKSFKGLGTEFIISIPGRKKE
jgi:signal transduction histidine kinase